MKSLIGLIVSLSVSSLTSNVVIGINPITSYVNGFNAEPQFQFYQENISNDLSAFDGVSAIHDNLVTSYIDTQGLTRAWFNLFDNNNQLIKQFDIDSLSHSQLGLDYINSVINYSNAISIDNLIINYIHADTSGLGSSDKLIIIDIESIDNPSYYFIDLINNPNSVDSPVVSIDKQYSSFNLQYINNNLYLTSVDENIYYTVSLLTYDLLDAANESGYILGSSLIVASSNSSLETPTEENSLDYCLIFSSLVYCLDNDVIDTLYYLDLDLIDNIYPRIYFYNRHYVGKLTVNNVTTVKVYYIDKLVDETNQVVDLTAVEVASFEATSSNIEFIHLDVNDNSLVMTGEAETYRTNLETYQTTISSNELNNRKQIYYNNLGKRVAVHHSGDQLVVESDYEERNYIINLNGLVPITYNYYLDNLLILAKDNTNSTYYYYSYSINQAQTSSNPTAVYSFTTNELMSKINEGYDDFDENSVDFAYTDFEVINIVAAKFYQDQLYLIENGWIIDGENYLNIVKVLPSNLIRVYFYQLDPVIYIDYDSFRINDIGNNDKNIKLKAVIESDGFPEAGDLMLLVSSYTPGVASIFSLATYSEVDEIGSFIDEGITHIYSIDIYNHYINYQIGETIYSIFIPDQALISLVNRGYGSLITDFSAQFPYFLIRFYLDEHNNLFIEDGLNNIYILYSPSHRSNKDIAQLSVNNQLLDVDANSFDLAVSANINTLSISLKTYFKRVLVTNSSPFNLNIGQNALTITLKALDNSTNSITFNVLKAQPIKRSPAVVLPGLDPNYVSSSSSNVISSSIISSVTSSSSSISMTSSSDIGSTSSSNSSLSSTNSSIISASSTIVDNNKAPNFTIENPFILVFLMLFPLAIITGIILLSKGNKRKIKKKKNLNK
jgi:hypothetical protein